MHRFRRKLTIVLTTLLMAVVVLMPVLESVACSSEVTTLQTDSPVGSIETQFGQGDSEHAICVHSHCHHSSATVLPDPCLDRNIDPRSGASVLMLEVAQHPSAPLDGLMRPPRI